MNKKRMSLALPVLILLAVVGRALFLARGGLAWRVLGLGMMVIAGFLALLPFVAVGSVIVVLLFRGRPPLIMEPLTYLTFPLVKWLAERQLFFVALEEGTMACFVRGPVSEIGPKTGKPIVKKGGAFVGAAIQQKGYTLSRIAGKTGKGKKVDQWDMVLNGTLVNGQAQREPLHPYGGIRFFLWPLVRPLSYEFQLSGENLQGETKVYPYEVLHLVYSKPDVYRVDLVRVEDQDQLDLQIALNVGMRVVNPYKALMQIGNVGNWLDVMIARIRALVRSYIGGNRYEDLHTRQTQVGGEVWKWLVKTGRIREFRNQYGVEVLPGTVEFVQIDPAEARRALTQMRYAADQQAAATRTVAAGIADAQKVVVEETGKAYQDLISGGGPATNLGQLAAAILTHLTIRGGGVSRVEVPTPSAPATASTVPPRKKEEERVLTEEEVKTYYPGPRS